MRLWFKKNYNDFNARHLERKEELMITSSASDNAALVKRFIIIYGIVTEYLRKYL